MTARRRKPLYTTKEYMDALKSDSRGAYTSSTLEYGIFATAEAADHDAQFLVDYYKRHGKRVKKPTVYRIRLEKV